MSTANKTNIGHVTQIIGSTFDAEYPENSLPSIYNAVKIEADVKGTKIRLIGEGVMTVNGHCTYLPGNQWILNDTYPQGRERLQSPYLCHVASGRKVTIGQFPLPSDYRGEWRCDTHPRFSPDGKSVVIDSPHMGEGRQLFLIDISAIVGDG